LWKHRRAVGSLLAAIRRHGRSDPKAAAQALVCLPRLVEIADRINSEGADVTHAFWSRHVGLVLPLLESIGSPSLRTAFVGAYDLVADDFILDLTADAAAILVSHAEVNRLFLERKAAPSTSIEIIHRGVPLMEQQGEGGRDPFRWITASALVPAKNVDAVIRGFAAARAREPRLRLDIFGDGPDRPRLERIAAELGCADAVNFRGHIPRDRLFAEMTGAALFLLLSVKPSERLPNVIKEALWAGCSVVSSNSEGIEELIPDSSVGFVVDPSDGQALADVLRGLLGESEQEREQRRSKARELIRSRFSSDASMAAYVAAWTKRLPA
jgi:glycosyltransferase involved in cell wall biosynthesis